MRLYTVHHRQEATGSLTGLADDAILVKDGFSWPAFLVPLVWLVYKRMWIVLAFYIAASAGLTAFAYAGVATQTMVTVGTIALNLILGLEGNDLYRWTLGRRRYREQAVVSGRGLVAAEQRYFDMLADALGRRRATAVAPGDSTA